MSQTVSIPDEAEHDLTIFLPNGEAIVLQYRSEGDYPSLDICFEKRRTVLNWGIDMAPAPSQKDTPESHDVFQLWIGLDPNTPNFHDSASKT